MGEQVARAVAALCLAHIAALFIAAFIRVCWGGVQNIRNKRLLGDRL